MCMHKMRNDLMPYMYIMVLMQAVLPATVLMSQPGKIWLNNCMHQYIYMYVYMCISML